MVDNEYRIDEYKFSKISIGTIIKNTEMLRLVPGHPKTKKMCKHAVEKIVVRNKIYF